MGLKKMLRERFINLKTKEEIIRLAKIVNKKKSNEDSEKKKQKKSKKVVDIVNAVEDPKLRVEILREMADDLDEKQIDDIIINLPHVETLDTIFRDEITSNVPTSTFVRVVPKIKDPKRKYNGTLELLDRLNDMQLIQILKNFEKVPELQEKIEKVLSKKIARNCVKYGYTIHLDQMIEFITDEEKRLQLPDLVEIEANNLINQNYVERPKLFTPEVKENLREKINNIIEKEKIKEMGELVQK